MKTKTVQEWVLALIKSDQSSAVHPFHAIVEAIQLDAKIEAYTEAAAIAKAHRQELFEDGLQADLTEVPNKVQAFCEGMKQERECIVDEILAARDKLKAK